MRTIASVLVALIAIIGMGAATVYDITILAPVDGEVFEEGSKIYVNTECNAGGNGLIVTRILVDGKQSDSDILTLAVGTHTITAEAADNAEFANALSDTVTIEVIDTSDSGKDNAPGQNKEHGKPVRGKGSEN